MKRCMKYELSVWRNTHTQHRRWKKKEHGTFGKIEPCMTLATSIADWSINTRAFLDHIDCFSLRTWHVISFFKKLHRLVDWLICQLRGNESPTHIYNRWIISKAKMSDICQLLEWKNVLLFVTNPTKWRVFKVWTVNWTRKDEHCWHFFWHFTH